MTSFWGHQDNPFPPAEPRRPRCPVCGEECETPCTVKAMRFSAGIVEVNAWEWKEEQEEQ